jgi:tRNA nucleotidyltransferase (CCA-adding enzyme)
MQISMKPLPLRMRTIVAQAVRAADGLGLSLYLVGGPVRDLLLRRSCRDLDLAVEGDALALAKRLAAADGAEVVEPSPQFGTATVRWPDGVHLDLARTRSETYAAPAALPKVTPADIRTDLGRRDFSINALALALNGPARGQVLDLFQGRADLKRRQIRIVHAQSFNDDPTRLFRAVRFERRLGFSLEAKTRHAFQRALDQGRIGQLSGARVLKELVLVMQEDDYAAGLRHLARRGVLGQVHPGLKPLPATLTAGLEKALAAFRRWGLGEADANLVKFLSLARSLTRAEMTSCLARFRFSQTWARALAWQHQQGVKLAQTLARRTGLSPAQWEERLEGAPRENLILLLAWKPKAVWRRGLQNFLRRWARVKPVLTGKDLNALGYAPGPGFGKMLSALRRAQWAGKTGTRAAAEKYLRTHFKTAVKPKRNA